MLPISSGLLNRLEVFEEIDSTNLALAKNLAENPTEWPDFSAVAALSQTAGRGRQGRGWASGPGASVSVSLLLRPPPFALPWITLTAGLAMAAAVRALAPGTDAGLKWPNDVLIDGKKISGILAQLQPGGQVVLGAGLNLSAQPQAPDTAVSLQELGVLASFDEALAQFLAAFRSRYLKLTASKSAGIADIRAELSQRCITLEQRVRVELPDGSNLTGLAREIDELGRLVVHCPEPVALSAGDVWHLRTENH